MQNKPLQTAYKGDRCAHCDKAVQDELTAFGSGALSQFEFHHVDPAKKDRNYDNLIRRNVSTQQLDELDKCVLVCSNCHRLAESQGITGHLELTVKVQKRRAKQVLRGSVIVNSMSKTVTFLTNEKVIAIPYWVEFPKGPQKLKFGTELKSGLLHKYLANLETIGWLKVYSFDHSMLLLDADYNQNRRVDFRVSTRFPIIQARFFEESVTNIAEAGEANIVAWLRNGSVVTRSGTLLRHGMVTFPDLIIDNLPTDVLDGTSE